MAWLRAVGSLPLSRKRPMCLHILAPGLQVKEGGAVSAGAPTMCIQGPPCKLLNFRDAMPLYVDLFRALHSDSIVHDACRQDARILVSSCNAQGARSKSFVPEIADTRYPKLELRILEGLIMYASEARAS
jgi:hypothetical protein